MFDVILQFFGKILLWIYNFCGNYALALIIFTLLTKLVLFPLSYKGKRSMMQMNALNEEQQRLQKQYGKNQERLSQELSKLYEEQGVSPMGGCLYSLLPLPILMGLYSVIRQPMRFMLCLTEEQVATAVEAAAAHGLTFADATSASYQEITLMSAMAKDTELYNSVAAALGDAATQLQTIDFDLFGLDLGAIPTWQFWTWESFDWAHIGLFLIPILVTILNYFYTQFSMKTNQIKTEEPEDEESKKKKKNQPDAAANTNKTMMIVMPLMYLWFGYIMPAGMCIYMAASTVFSALQDVIFSKFLNKKFAAEAAERKAKIAAQREQEKAKKAEIAARRAAMEEELKKKGGKKALKQAQKKNRDSAAGAIGVRRYARGRAYEADRYPTTPYRDPQDVLDEEALERALISRGNKNVEIEEEEVEAVETVETVDPVETVETAETQDQE